MQFDKKDEKIFTAFCQVAYESEYRTDITMSKIAEKLGMSRQGINQSYYKNVNEIIKAMQVWCDQEVRELLHDFVARDKQSLVSYLSDEIVPLLYEKRYYLKILYANVVSPWYQYMITGYSDIVRPYFEKSATLGAADVEFYTRLSIRQILSIFASWLESDDPEPPVTFSVKFAHLLNSGVSSYLDL